MISLTCILICALAPFIGVFVITRILFHFVEKLLDYLIDTVFSLPERILDSIKEKFSNKEALSEKE